MLQIGEKVKANRIRAGLTQAQLAEAADVGTPFIANIEGGQKMMSVPTLLAIADALEVSCDTLLRPSEGTNNLRNILLLLNACPTQHLIKVERIPRVLLAEFPPENIDTGEKCGIISSINS